VKEIKDMVNIVQRLLADGKYIHLLIDWLIDCVPPLSSRSVFISIIIIIIII
jgi:hypothetical protein